MGATFIGDRYPNSVLDWVTGADLVTNKRPLRRRSMPTSKVEERAQRREILIERAKDTLKEAPKEAKEPAKEPKKEPKLASESTTKSKKKEKIEAKAPPKEMLKSKNRPPNSFTFEYSESEFESSDSESPPTLSETSIKVLRRVRDRPPTPGPKGRKRVRFEAGIVSPPLRGILRKTRKEENLGETGEIPTIAMICFSY